MTRTAAAIEVAGRLDRAERKLEEARLILWGVVDALRGLDGDATAERVAALAVLVAVERDELVRRFTVSGSSGQAVDADTFTRMRQRGLIGAPKS